MLGIKKSKLLILFLLVLLPAGFIIAQQKNKFAVEIATWYHNSPGAVSISFDDACYTQYQYAYPVLKKFNFKATFSLVGVWTHDKPTCSAEPGYFKIKKMGWDEIRELHAKGNEIAAHGYEHVRYGKHTPKSELIKQMSKVKKLIEEQLKTQIYTLHYPFSFTTDNIVEASKEAGFLFSRTGRDSINPASPANMNYLVSKAILNNSTPDSLGFENWLKQAKGKWLILMYHHLFTENSKETKLLQYHKVTNTYSLYPKTFEKQMQMIAGCHYWVAPIATIGKYIVERNNTDITVRKHCRRLIIKPESNVNYSVYNQPLTINVTLPWKTVTVTGSIKDGIYKTKNSKLLIDVLPGHKVIIKKTK